MSRVMDYFGQYIPIVPYAGEADPLAIRGGDYSFGVNYISDIHSSGHGYYLKPGKYPINIILGDTSDTLEDSVLFYKELRDAYVGERKAYKREAAERMKEDRLDLYHVKLLLDFCESRLADVVVDKTIYDKYCKAKDYAADNIFIDTGTRIERCCKRRGWCAATVQKIKHIYSLERTVYELRSQVQHLTSSIADCNSILAEQDFNVTVYVVLGNHECWEFSTVEEAVDKYRPALQKLGFTLLHNEYVVLDCCVLYGGPGGLKYEQVHSAGLIFKEGDNSAEEARQTDLFEAGYRQAKQVADSLGLPLVCASHYPGQSCLEHGYEKDVIYFNGHTHHNGYELQTTTAYFDNQVGRFKRDFEFKTVWIRDTVNPFYELGDGVHEISVDDYILYERYRHERQREGKRLRKYDKMYCIKSCNYYGFFCTGKTGTFVVSGFTVRKVLDTSDIGFIYSKFDLLLNRYLELLNPLMQHMKQMSEYMQGIGWSGRIHGMIIDIDFYHHVMVNPVTGQSQCYFSQAFGLLKKIDTVEALADSFAKNSPELLTTLDKVDTSLILQTEISVDHEMEVVPTSGGSYSASRRIYKLQRIFETNTLREFDLSLLENCKSLDVNL